MYVISSKSVICMGLLISRPSQYICMGIGSLFVYGFRRFRGKVRPLRRKNRIYGSENSITRNLYFSCIPFSPSYKYEIRIYGRVELRIFFTMVATAEEFFPPTWSGLCWLGWRCHYCFTCSQNELNCKTVRNYGILRIKTQTTHTFWIFLGTGIEYN